MTRAFTHKPCPGCGLNVAIAPGTVCHNCTDAIRNFSRVKAAAAALESGRFFSLTRGIAPKHSYKMAGTPVFEEAFAGLLGELCQTTPLSEVTEHCESLDRFYADWNVGDTLPEPKAFLVIGKEIRAHLHRVFHAIDALLRQSHADGVLKGQDLLGQLSSGALSMRELNQKTIDAERVFSGR